MKKRIIPSWLAPILISALNIYVPSLLAQVASESLRAALGSIFQRVINIINAVSDADPNNSAQIEAEAKKFISEDAVPLASDIIDEKIAQIENERARLGFGLLAVPIVDFARIATDDNPNNGAQAEAIFDDFITNPQVHEFIIGDLIDPILAQRITDPILRSFVLQALSTGLKEGADKLAAGDTFNVGDVTNKLDAAADVALNAGE